MVMTLLDDHGSLPAIFVPTTVQTAIMSIVAVLGSSTTKLTVRTIIAAISGHVPIAANTGLVRHDRAFRSGVRRIVTMRCRPQAR
jgi:hypothetical protein